jgi:hypothetical protein
MSNDAHFVFASLAPGSLGGSAPDSKGEYMSALHNGGNLSGSRAWAAVGYPSPPGVCKSVEENATPLKLGK